MWKASSIFNGVIKVFLSINFVIIITPLKELIFLETNDVLVNLKRSGVNLINVLRTAFAPVDPESVKRYLTVIFMLLGYTSVKAVRRTLMKSSPGDYFTNIQCRTLEQLLYHRLLMYYLVQYMA